MRYSLTQIKEEIQAQIEKGEQWHYDYPSAQRLVKKHVVALQAALTAITLADKFANKAVEEWIAQQKASGQWGRR